MKRKLISKSAFFTPRFLTGFALCSIGVFLALMVFAHPTKPVGQQNQSVAQQSVHTFVGAALPAPKDAIVPIGSIRPVKDQGLIDLAELDIHPIAAPLPLRALSSGAAGSPEGAAMGTARLF